MPILRRDVLKFALAAPVSVALGGNQPVSPVDLTLTQAAEAIRVGDISAVEYAGALIRQHEAWRGINSFISFDHESLLSQARRADQERKRKAVLGPLHGVPLAFKDNIATSELPTTAGTGALRNYRPATNAAVAQSLFDVGALLFGKNNMHELAAGITSNNGNYGAVRNPYDMTMIAGGSSGGTGAAIAARIVPGGLGTDTGGSVRIPASLCGTVGFRPTTGRYSSAGLVPFASGTAVAGPMARTVEDVALLDRVITGDAEMASIRLSSLRLGVPEAFFYDDLEADVADVCSSTLKLLESAGVELVHRPVAGLEELLLLGRGGPAPGETVAAYAEFFRSSGMDLSVEDYIGGIAEPAIRERLQRQLSTQNIAAQFPATSAVAVRSRYAALLSAYFLDNSLDAMAVPPTPLSARPVGHDDTVGLNGRQVSTFRTYVRNTAIGSAAGLPGIVVPAGQTSNSLPVGIEFDAPPGTDRRLLSIAKAVAEILPPLAAPRLLA